MGSMKTKRSSSKTDFRSDYEYFNDKKNATVCRQDPFQLLFMAGSPLLPATSPVAVIPPVPSTDFYFFFLYLPASLLRRTARVPAFAGWYFPLRLLLPVSRDTVLLERYSAVTIFV